MIDASNISIRIAADIMAGKGSVVNISNERSIKMSTDEYHTSRVAKEMTDEEKVRRQKKTKSVRHLAGQIHKLRSKVTKDLKADDEKLRMTALAVAIIDKTAERVGNESSAKDGHYGVTGFQNSHITVSGNEVSLKYVGKSGVEHEKSFTDKTMAKMLKECKGRCKNKNAPVMMTSDGFKIRPDKVNRYLKEFGVTAKDIRGYAANTLVEKMLKNSKAPSDKEERKKKFREVLKSVAEKVGHQQATLKMHYLLPGVEEAYVKSGKVNSVKNASITSISIVAASERVALGEVGANYTRNVVRVIKKACKEITGKVPEVSPIRVAVNDWDLPEGKVGSYLHPTSKQPFGLLTVSPKAFETDKYKHVISHELIHALIGPQDDPHGELFRKIADELGMPKELQD